MKISAVSLGLAVLGALLAAIASLIGIFSPETYARETHEWAVQAVGQDCANLPVALVLLWSSVLTRRGSTPALLIWLGCLLYLVYAFTIYAFAVHFNSLFLVYVVVLGLSFYALVSALVSLDIAVVTGPLADHPHRTGASNLLILIGALFALLWLSEIVPHLVAHSIPKSLTDTGLLTNPVHVLDLAFFLPAMTIVGVLLRRQHRLGLLYAVPLLVFAVAIGLVILVLFTLSAVRGLPVAVPAAVVVSLIVGVSGVYTWLLLRPFGRRRN